VKAGDIQWVMCGPNEGREFYKTTRRLDTHSTSAGAIEEKSVSMVQATGSPREERDGGGWLGVCELPRAAEEGRGGGDGRKWAIRVLPGAVVYRARYAHRRMSLVNKRHNVEKEDGNKSARRTGERTDG